MRIPRSLVEEVVAHARAEAPDECCGMISARDGEAVAVHRARNAQASPLRYEIDGRDQLRILEQIDREGLQLGAIYHSHTRSDPVPSQTDINLARLWPDPLYVIVGVAGEADVRAFRIRDGQVDEAALEIE
jgi:[CysO sulfur-carrier protein]-S-L-cysteine hydrolase